MNPTVTLTAAALCGALGSTSTAAMPEAMTMIPEGTDAMIVMPDVGEMLRDADTLNAMLGANSSLEVTLATALVRGMPGLDLTRSGAVAIDFDAQNPGAEPEFIALVPVGDFGALSQGRPAQDGVVALEMGADAVFLRSLGGGYAAIGTDAAGVRGFTPADRSEEELGALLGTAGVRIADANDVFFVLDMGAIRPMLEQSFDEIEAQGDMVELMAGPEAAAGVDAMLSVYKTAVRDGRALLQGMNFDRETGLSFDVAMQFADSSDTASKLHNDGRAGLHMRHVPVMDFFTAWSFDASGDGIRSMLDGYAELAQATDTTGVSDMIDLGEVFTAYEGGAFVMGATDAMMMNGVLSRSVFYGASEDPQGSIGVLRGMYAATDQAEQQGVRVTASLSDEPASVEGVEVYEHSLRFEMDPAMAGGMGGPSPAMAMQMMFGPNLGPSGYAAPVEGGVVMTMSKDRGLLSRSVAAATGAGGLKEDPGVAAVSALLPENRVLEGYVSMEHVLNAVGPMLMMFGVVPEFEPLDAMVPMAMGATADGGALMLRTVIPTSTVTTIAGMLPEDMGGMMGVPGGPGAGPDGGDDDEDIAF